MRCSALHGTLAPNAKWRRLIVPATPAKAGRECGAEVEPQESARAASSRASRMSWAELMLRVFKTDVLECRRCDGRLRIVATVTTPSAVKAILECLGLPPRPPPVAREREQAEFRFEG